MNIRKIARDFARRTVAECELMEEGMPVLIGADESRIRYEPRHTVDHPFCDDHRCPCHYELSSSQELSGAIDAGLITEEESTRLVWAENI